MATTICILQFKTAEISKYYIYIDNNEYYSIKEYIDFYNQMFGGKSYLFLHKYFTLENMYLSEETCHFLHEKEISDQNISEKTLFNFVKTFENHFANENSEALFLIGLTQEEISFSHHYILCFEYYNNTCILLENSDFVQDILQKSRFLEKIKAYEEYDIVEPEKFQAFLRLSVNSIKDVPDKLESIESLCDIGALKNIFFTTQQKLRNIILNHYEITLNEKHKIKCSELNEKLEYLGVAFDKKTLLNVLSDLQVTKKRYSNGFYWVKLKEK